MSRRMKSVAEIAIGGNAAKHTRAEIARRRSAEASAVPLDDTDAAELKRLDSLIEAALIECSKGHVGSDGKSAPCFRHLNLLTQIRARILGAGGRPKPVKKILSGMDHLDEVLKGIN